MQDFLHSMYVTLKHYTGPYW